MEYSDPGGSGWKREGLYGGFNGRDREQNYSLNYRSSLIVVIVYVIPYTAGLNNYIVFKSIRSHCSPPTIGVACIS